MNSLSLKGGAFLCFNYFGHSNKHKQKYVITYLICSFVSKIEKMKVVNYTDLRLNLKKWMDLVVNDVEELIIKRKDNKDLVLIPLDEYNSLKETSYLLTGKNRDVLMKSLSEAKGGKTEEHVLTEDED
jgi:antitoxin YefM